MIRNIGRGFSIGAIGLRLSSRSNAICREPFMTGLSAGRHPSIHLQVRHFTPVEVKSPLGGRLLKKSKSVMKGIGLAYLAGFLIVLKMYFGLKSKADSEQPIPRKWPFMIKWLVRNGVNDEMDRNYYRAAKYLGDALKFLDEEYEKNPNQQKEWLAGYSDTNIRLGLVKTKLQESEEAQKYLDKGYQINHGLRYLKGKAGVLLGIYAYKLDKNEEQAESFLRTAVADSAAAGEFPELEKIVLSTDGGIEVPQGTELGDDQIPALLELGKLFAKTGRLNDGLVTLLSTYRGISESSDSEKKPRGEIICARALIRAHIAEIVWALGNQKQAVAWAEEAYKLSKNFSHTTAECGACAKMATGLVSKMYTAIGMDERAAKFKKLHENQLVPKLNLTRQETRWTMF